MRWAPVAVKGMKPSSSSENEKAVFECAGEKLLKAVSVLRLDEIVDEGGGAAAD